VTGNAPGIWIAGLTCAGTADCVATDSAGDVLTTVDPTAATPSWTSNNVNGTSVIWDVSCPASTLCVGVDVTGSILTGKEALPAVSKVSPNSGPTTGGTSITITGTGFVTGATVVIGQGNGTTGALAATVKSITSSTITATTPGGAKAGTWNLFVTTPAGTSAANAGDYFSYTS